MIKLTKTEAKVLQALSDNGKLTAIDPSSKGANFAISRQEKAVESLTDKKLVTMNKPPHSNLVISGKGLEALSQYTSSK